MDLVATFRTEYDRLNREAYDGKLPPFPGCEVGSSLRTYGQTRWSRWEGDRPVFRAFRLSKYIATKPDLAINVIRHEIAHLAALHFEGRAAKGHGWRWERHALKCGAEPSRCASEKIEHDKKPVGVVRCTSCPMRKEFYRRGRILSDPTRYRCALCRGTLTLEMTP